MDHDPIPGFGSDKTAAKKAVAAFTAVRRNVSFDTLDIIVDGERAATHWTMHWTHIGPMMGVPADGKELHFRGHDFFHMRDNEIAEIWHCEDVAGVLRQIGVPRPGVRAFTQPEPNDRNLAICPGQVSRVGRRGRADTLVRDLAYLSLQRLWHDLQLTLTDLYPYLVRISGQLFEGGFHHEALGHRGLGSSPRG